MHGTPAPGLLQFLQVIQYAHMAENSCLLAGKNINRKLLTISLMEKKPVKQEMAQRWWEPLTNDYQSRKSNEKLC